MLIVSSFYKYTDLNNPENLQKEHLDFCKKLNIKGKILISTEGINGAVSGTKEQIKKYEAKLSSYKEFSDITFKKNKTDKHPFRKTIVRIKNEIVTSKFKINAKNVGKHISPKKLKELYDNNEDFVILDARNDYESKIGRFKNAITPNIKIFKDFKKIIKQLEIYKNKKIVMYCTGGVRCEKASALLLKGGFKDVNQLKDGILNYIEQYPDTYFEGRCFVFDNRLSIPTGVNTKEIAVCEKCHIACGEYTNCNNKRCDRLFIFCKDCKKQYNNTCSKTCRALVTPSAVFAEKDVILLKNRTRTRR